ncbi:MAG: glycerol-3-phosphate acyltransferase [Candidatus Paceibacterota bacterium]
MALFPILLIIAIFSYLLGSIPFALVFNKLIFKQDPRQTGSKNLGALNTLRISTEKKGKIIGALSFLIVFLLDAGKGVIAVFFAQKLALATITNPLLLGPEGTSVIILVASMVAALLSVVGHNYSLYLKFKGGRGAATLFGITLFLNCQLAWLWAGIVLLVIIIGEILAGHKFNKKLIPQAINNQILGRLIGEILGLGLIYFLNPYIFAIVCLPLLPVLLAHSDRLEEQMKKIKAKNYLAK